MNTIKYSASVSVDKGLIRNNNEDNFYFNGTYLFADERDNAVSFSSVPSNRIQIYGVFDGMGGEALGEEASLIAAEATAKAHEKLMVDESNITREFLSLIEKANAQICKKIVESGERRIGTTFAALAINDDKATVFNVGDSRVYLLRNGELQQISVDDTIAQRMVNIGAITDEEAKTHKDRHKLTQHLGIFKDEMMVEPHVYKTIDIKKDDIFLLCSDGLTDMLSDSEIFSVLNENKSCEDMSKALIKKALKNGGHDNVTSIVVKAETDRKKQKRSSFSKRMIMTALLILIALVICGVVAVYDDSDDVVEKESAPVSNIYFSNPVEKIKIGTQNAFMIGVEPAGANVEVKFTSSDPSVLEIDEITGFYKAVSVGNAIVKATVEDVDCELEVTVYKPADDITGIPKEMPLAVGEKTTIQYTLMND